MRMDGHAPVARGQLSASGEIAPALDRPMARAPAASGTRSWRRLSGSRGWPTGHDQRERQPRKPPRKRHGTTLAVIAWT